MFTSACHVACGKIAERHPGAEREAGLIAEAVFGVNGVVNVLLIENQIAYRTLHRLLIQRPGDISSEALLLSAATAPIEQGSLCARFVAAKTNVTAASR
jgi:hypothetical protein